MVFMNFLHSVSRFVMKWSIESDWKEIFGKDIYISSGNPMWENFRGGEGRDCELCALLMR